MIATRFPRRGSAPQQRHYRREEQRMESLISGTFVGAGSFRCRRCGYVLTLEGTDTLTDCPGCGGDDFARASLFSTQRLDRMGDTDTSDATLVQPVPPE